jgi:hypothetical protein
VISPDSEFAAEVQRLQQRPVEPRGREQMSLLPEDET